MCRTDLGVVVTSTVEDVRKHWILARVRLEDAANRVPRRFTKHWATTRYLIAGPPMATAQSAPETRRPRPRPRRQERPVSRTLTTRLANCRPTQLGW
jgi:hypothetical protein